MQEPVRVCVYVVECLQSEGLVSDPMPFLRHDWAYPTSDQTWWDYFPSRSDKNILGVQQIHMHMQLTEKGTRAAVPFMNLWKITKVNHTTRTSDICTCLFPVNNPRQ